MRENIVYLTQSNYTFSVNENYEIVVLKFGKTAGSYSQPKQCSQKRNNEALSFNHCCSGNAIRMAHSECVFVALGFHHDMGMRHITTCGLSGSTIFFSHYLIKGTILETKLWNINCAL